MEKPTVRVVVESDLAEIQSWLDKRPKEHVDVDLATLPPNGLIVPGVMAMFWAMTDGPVIYGDSFISNPEASKEARLNAGRVMGYMILQVARAHKVRRILFLTRNPAMADIYAKIICAKPVNTFTLFCTEVDELYPDEYKPRPEIIGPGGRVE